MDKNKITDEFLNTMIKSDSKQLALEIGEFTIDQLLDESLLKDIPIVGWVFKAKQVYSSISDKIFLAKLSRFLLNLSDITPEEKEKLKKIFEDKNQRAKIGTNLLLLLDKISNLEKLEIMAKIFIAYVANKITFEEFLSLGNAVEIAFIEDLKFLKEDTTSYFSSPYRKTDPSNEFLYQEKVNRLLRCGLSEITSSFNISTNINQSQVDIPINLSHLGIILQTILGNENNK